jgi:hypothetical protein
LSFGFKNCHVYIVLTVGIETCLVLNIDISETINKYYLEGRNV